MLDISGSLRPINHECGFEDLQHDLSVNSCGYQKFITKNFSRHREKGRLDYQILYIAKGKGRFLIQGDMQTVTEGDIVVYRPGVEQFYSYEYKDQTEVYWVHFTGRHADAFLKLAGISDQRVFHIGLNSICITLFQQVMTELQLKRHLFESFAPILFQELVLQIGRRTQEMMNGQRLLDGSNLQKVIATMHTSYHLHWILNDFAKDCNLSSYRFIHNFKKYTGLAPMEYLTKVRIDKSRELLQDSSLNIAEIAMVIGYDNPLYFSRIFKSKTGMSPSQYRKSSMC